MKHSTEEVKELFESTNSVTECRKLFPITDSCVYLDSAHYGPYSLETRRCLIEFIDRFTYTNLNLTLANMKNGILLKEKVAELINAKPDEIIITSSTTHGLNIFAHGINLNKGDSVAYADSEFPAVAYPWMNIEKLRGVKNVIIPSDNGKIKMNDIESSVKRSDVKILTISSVGFLGFRNDIDVISKLCKDNECYLVVDAIQSIGIVPFDAEVSSVDYLAAGSQKWMMSPSGIGFAYIPERMQKIVSPTFIGTMSIKFDFDNFLDYKLDYVEGGTAYENSTLNCLGMIGMISNIDLFLKVGVENIFNHILELQDIFIEEMSKDKFEICSSLAKGERSNILIFSHLDPDRNKQIQKQLEKENIFIALREGFLRISPHLFNNFDDIYKLTTALKKF